MRLSFVVPVHSEQDTVDEALRALGAPGLDRRIVPVERGR